MTSPHETANPSTKSALARLGHALAVTLYVLVVCAPALGLMKRLPDAVVVGAVLPQERPKLSVSPWMQEKFQPAFVTWFELNLWLRGTFVYADNSVLYHAFHETKPGATVKLAKDNILINDEDTGHLSRLDVPSRKTLDGMVARIAKLQLRLQRDGAALVPVIIPSKGSIYPDMVEDRWKLNVATPRPSDVLYTDLVRALREQNVTFVDARALLTARPEPRPHLFPRGARHWSFLGSCLVTQQAFKAYTDLTGKSAPPYDCAYTLGAAPPADHQDYDLYRLMNVWGAPADKGPAPVFQYSQVPQNQLDLLIVGTSFGWNFLRDSDRTHAFRTEHYFYYDKIIVEWPSAKMTPLVVNSPEWRNAVTHKQLYILDLFETYPMPEHATMFLDDMDAHYQP